MPQNIHGGPHYATSPPPPDHFAHMQHQINALTQQLAHTNAMLQQALTHPNPAPAPPSGIGQDALLQLLLQERDRSDRWQSKLMESNDPAAQIKSLIALSEILPQPEAEDDDSGLLKNAVEALGGILLGGMDSDDADPGYTPPPIGNAPNDPSQQPPPDNPLHVAVDSGDGYKPTAFGNLDVGE